MVRKKLKRIKLISFFGLMLSLSLLILGSAYAGRTISVRIDGKNFEPNKLTAYPGDTLRICNESNYRRQPFSGNRYNRFGRRTPDRFEMIRKGECKEVKLQNPTNNWLKVMVRDAVAEKAKLMINISPVGGK